MKIHKELLDTEAIITIIIFGILSIGMMIGMYFLCKTAKTKNINEEKLKEFCQQECTENNEINYECSNQCYDWYIKGKH